MTCCDLKFGVYTIFTAKESCPVFELVQSAPSHLSSGISGRSVSADHDHWRLDLVTELFEFSHDFYLVATGGDFQDIPSTLLNADS